MMLFRVVNLWILLGGIALPSVVCAQGPGPGPTPPPSLPLSASNGGTGEAGTITGALKGNGTGAVTQAGAADLSNGATGTGAVVLATSPTLTTPALGTPSALVCTNCTGLPPAGVTGTAITLSGTGQALTGGFHPTAPSPYGTSGSIAIDCGNAPLQQLTNGGTITLTMTANDGNCVVRVTNNGSAGVITLSGFSEGTNTGDALTTTSGNKFDIVLTRIGGNPHYLISALQ